jgi:hypothetical protein
MATSATTQNWQNKENTGIPIYAHIIYLHTPHCIGHIWYKKWTNRSREYNSRRWLSFIDFPYTRTIYLSFWCYIIAPHKKHYRLYSLKNRTNHTWTPQTTIFRFTDLNDLLRFCYLFLVTETTSEISTAPSTAANSRKSAQTTIWSAVDIVRRLDGTGQAQKFAGSCLENAETGLRVDRCHLLTIHQYISNAVVKLTSGLRNLHHH